MALERADGTAVTGRAAQRRRLALLSLLALAPSRCLSRDRLLAYLWPESETEQARHLLAVAIYELRKALGEDLIASRGDELDLGAASLRVDVHEFEEAVQRSEWERADALYAGPLLDGFYIADAPEFERWLDGERERLARLYALALHSLAGERSAAANHDGALEAMRRLAAIDPYNSRVALELMTALEAAGDRAGALRHATVHAALLREEFGAEPDPTVEDYARKLRTAPTGVAAPSAVPSTATLQDAPLAASPTDLAKPTSAETGAPVPSLDRSTPPDGGESPAAPSPDGAAGEDAPVRAHGRARAAALRGRPVLNGRRVLALSAAAVVLVVAVGSQLWQSRGRAYAAECVSSPSIAVFPFRTLSATPETSTFGDGLAEEILNTLSDMECIDVVPRTAAFEYREGNPQDAARALRVSHSLTASLQGDSQWLRVNPRLTETATGRLVWTERYTRTGPWTLQDLAEVQQEIALAIGAELGGRLTGTAPAVRARTANVRAYQALYSGRASLERRTVPDLMRARQLFAEAAQLDPDYADAHAAFAEATVLLGAYDYGLLHPRQAYPDAMQSAREALARDPFLAEAHATLGSVYFNHLYDWARADSAFRRAIEVKRGYSQSYHWQALLLAARGRMEEARAALEQGLSYDRNSVILKTALARNHYFARDWAASISGYEAVLSTDSSFLPAQLGLGMSFAQSGRLEDAIAVFQAVGQRLGDTPPVLHGLLAYSLGRAGRADEARAHLRSLHEAATATYVPAEYFALANIGVGDLDAAVADMEQAYANGSGGVAYVAIEPVLDPLRSLTRFQALAQRVGLR